MDFRATIKLAAFAIALYFAGLPLAVAQTSNPGLSENTASATCFYANRLYSVGATICECPSVIAASTMLTGPLDEAEIVESRRLVCSSAGNWVPAQTACVKLKFDRPGFAIPTFEKLLKEFCPDLRSGNTAKDIAGTTQDAGHGLIGALCDRLPNFGSGCNTLFGGSN